MIDLFMLKKIILSNDDNVIQILEGLNCHSINFKKSTKGPQIRFALPDHKNATSGCVMLNDYLTCIVFNPDFDYKGDLIGFVKSLKKIEFADALVWVCNKLNICIDKVEDFFPSLPIVNDNLDCGILSVHKEACRGLYNLTSSAELTSFEIKQTYNYVFAPHIALCKEGIGTDVQERFHIGYDLWSKRILFPHRFWNGKEDEYVGIIGRTTNPLADELGIPKYYPLESYPKRTNLYGLWENLRAEKPTNIPEEFQKLSRTIKDDKYIVIYEAEKSVLKRATWHDYTGVALMGHELHPEQISIINDLKDVHEVIFALDNDIPESKLKELCSKIEVKKTSYILDRNNFLGPKDSPADMNPYIFNELFKSRVKNY